jgi:putative transposase
MAIEKNLIEAINRGVDLVALARGNQGTPYLFIDF